MMLAVPVLHSIAPIFAPSNGNKNTYTFEARHPRRQHTNTRTAGCACQNQLRQQQQQQQCERPLTHTAQHPRPTFDTKTKPSDVPAASMSPAGDRETHVTSGATTEAFELLVSSARVGCSTERFHFSSSQPGLPLPSLSTLWYTCTTPLSNPTATENGELEWMHVEFSRRGPSVVVVVLLLLSSTISGAVGKPFAGAVNLLPASSSLGLGLSPSLRWKRSRSFILL